MAHNFSKKPNPGSGAMQSNVGNPQIYVADDQRTSKTQSTNPDLFASKQYQQSNRDPTMVDPKDQRTMTSRFDAAQKKERHDERVFLGKEPEDPRMPALRHGNEPSRGAKLDAQIQQEEMEELERKGKI